MTDATGIRPAATADAVALADLLNAIIRIGGTTAHERPLSPDEIIRHFIAGADAILCHVATSDNRLTGFQAIGRHPALPAGWGDTGTFVAPGLQQRGTGTRLFAATAAAARAAGLMTINATIRADNTAGLAYYARLGFVDYAAEPDFRLSDGTRVGRVSRRYNLT